MAQGDRHEIDALRCGITTGESGRRKNAKAITKALAGLEPGDILVLPPGDTHIDEQVEWPDLDGLALTGRGIYASTIEAAASTSGGIVKASRTRITGCRLSDFTLHGGGEVSGAGIDLADVDRGEFRRLRVYVWDTCVRIESTENGGALHNVIDNCRLTNAEKYGLWLTGAQGPHQTHITAGEFSLNEVGLVVDSPTDATSVEGTSFESNQQAIYSNGVRGQYLGIRLEGNESDVLFEQQSAYNLLRTAYWDGARHADYSLSKSNRVLPHGYWTSNTEYAPLLYIPADPMSAKLEPLTPGAGKALSHLFDVYEARYVTHISYVPTITHGNVDIALCNTDGKVIASTGPTPVGTDELVQTIPLQAPIWFGPGRRGYVAIMFDNDDAGVWGMKASVAGFQLGQPNVLAREKPLAFPFGDQDAVSGASGTTMTPYVAIG